MCEGVLVYAYIHFHLYLNTMSCKLCLSLLPSVSAATACFPNFAADRRMKKVVADLWQFLK
uniref:Uncharacterized protein n=1 Tax=Octopus bimaculoides TaxID=37653 RepID=A0A0L8H9F7_OCTBM